MAVKKATTKQKMKIKVGDKVKVITGKDAGTEGEVIRAIPRERRVVVRGVAMVKKHLRPTQANPSGGIEEREAPIDVSNVMLVCPHCTLPTRIGHRFKEDGTKVRVCKKCGKDID